MKPTFYSTPKLFEFLQEMFASFHAPSNSKTFRPGRLPKKPSWFLTSSATEERSICTNDGNFTRISLKKEHDPTKGKKHHRITVFRPEIRCISFCFGKLVTHNPFIHSGINLYKLAELLSLDK